MTEFTFLGELPAGKWEFCLVSIEGDHDAIIVVDKAGNEQPRMIIKGKLVDLEPTL